MEEVTPSASKGAGEGLLARAVRRLILFRRSPGIKSSLVNKLVLLFLFASIYPFSLVTFTGFKAMKDVVRHSTVEELRTMALAGESLLVAHLERGRAALTEAASEMQHQGLSAESKPGSLVTWRARLGSYDMEIRAAEGQDTSAGTQVAIRPESRAWEASVPLGDGAILVARWPLADLAGLWRGLAGRSRSVTVSLVGPDGQVVAHSAGSARGITIPQNVLVRLRSGTMGSLAYRSALGRLVLGAPAEDAVSRLLGGPWMVVVEEDVVTAHRPVEFLRYHVMRFGVVMLVLFTAIAVLFARSIMKPIQQLTEGARVIGRGQLDHRLAVKTGDEIELLAREFNSMAAELQASYSSLEGKIARATADLRNHMEQLAEERDKIDGILRSVTDGLVVTDRARRLLLANPAAETLFGFTLDEAEGRPMEEVIEPERVRAVLERLLEHPDDEVSEEVEFTPPGAEMSRVYLAHTAAVRDRHGNTLGVVTLFSDVTPFRELDRMKSEFLSMASHELRTPLTSIQGFSELLMMRKLDEQKQAKYLGYINTQSKRLAHLISDFLDVARIEAGRGFDLSLETTFLEPLVRECVEMFASRDIPHTFSVEVEEGLPAIEMDRNKMEQVFQNLLGNAVKYSPDGGTIRIRASSRQGAVLLEISDEGQGMTPEQLERIFDKFYRADASSGAIEGTGLGMFIVRFIVEAHHGAVWVESEEGRGTRVSMSLPCPEAEGPAVPEPARGQPASGRVV